MTSREACAEYFRRNPAWERAFLLIRKKWAAYGRMSGTVTLRAISEEEREALQKVLGRPVEGADGRFALAELEEALQRTRFAPITLKEVMDAYFGEETPTSREQKAAARSEREGFLDRLEGVLRERGCEDARLWLRALREERQYGYGMLLAEQKRSERDAECLIANIGQAIRIIRSADADAPVLAVLAAEVTGNPHYFDRGSTAGALLVCALSFLEGRGYPQDAYAWRELLLRCGIMTDEISNTVTVFGIHVETPDGLHPAFEGFCRMREPGVLTAATLKKVCRVYADSAVVYVVENEMVFSYLTERLRDRSVALVCTSGQPCSAALRLLELLAAEPARICYSGDIDPEGVGIAERLWRRFPHAVRIWRMDAGDYDRSVSGEPVSEKRMAMLDRIGCPALQGCVEKLRERRLAAYQENIRQDLLADIADDAGLTFSPIKNIV